MSAGLASNITKEGLLYHDYILILRKKNEAFKVVTVAL